MKKQYGVGYTFTIVKDSKTLALLGHKEQLEVTKSIKEVVSSHIKHSELLADVGAELSFRLPFEASSHFVPLFREIDSKLSELFVNQYGISVTTLEEVFIKVAEQTDADILEGARNSLRASETVTNRRSLAEINDNAAPGSMLKDAQDAAVHNILLSSSEENSPNITTIKGGYVKLGAEDEELEKSNKLNRVTVEKERESAGAGEYACIEDDTPGVVFVKHFKALLLKRIIYGKRDKQMFCCQLVLPIALVAFGLGILLLIPNLTQPDLVLSPSKFNPTYDPSQKNYVPFETLNGNIGNQLFGRFNGQSSPTNSADGGVWGQAVSMAEVYPDQFYSCGQGAAPLHEMSNYLLGQSDADKDSEKGSTRYGAYTVSAESTATSISYNAMVNGSAIHGAGIYVNLMDEAILQMISNNKQAQITTHNYPLPRTFSQEKMTATQSALTAAFFFMIAFAFVPASFATFIVKEREVKAKHQQVISGVSLYAYWCSSWVWDVMSYLVTYLLIIAVLFAYSLDAYTKGESGIATSLVFLMYGPSIASFTYLISYLFTSHSTAQLMVMMFNFITGLCLMIVAFILPLIEQSQGVAVPLRYLFRLFPSFCLGDSLTMLS